jgi:hypothetical protein
LLNVIYLVLIAFGQNTKIITVMRLIHQDKKGVEPLHAAEVPFTSEIRQPDAYAHPAEDTEY